MRFSNHIPPRPSASSSHRLVCCLLLMMTMMMSGIFVEPGQCATDAGDLQVLQDLLKGATNGAEKLADWTGDDPCGSPGWTYVQCSGSRVTGLQLKGAGLQGELPASLNRLSSLQTIALQGNSFSGPLPSLSGLSQLTAAYLGDQQFSSIPSDFFSGLTSLSILTLQNNPINASEGWSLPPDIALASGLTSLTLTNVSLSGAVPDSLGNLSSLQELHLAYNRLSGPLPASFSGLGQLARLELNNQQTAGGLSGPIDVVAQMPSLAYLWLQVNSFSGTIPPALGSSVSLQDCRLNDNALVGEIPSTFASSSSLQFLSVKNNKLVGPIPAIPSLNSTSYVFSGNNFCQSEVGAACAPDVTALLSFLGGVNYPSSLLNSWQGNDPCASWQGITCDSDKKHVTVVNLPRSQLTGTISPALANLTSLTRLILSGNNLTGTIPESLTQLTSLVLIDVSNNNIYGPLPTFNSRVSVVTTGNANINNVLPSPSPGSSSSSSPSGSNTNSAQGGSSGKSSFSMGAMAGVVVGVSAILFFAAIIGFVIFKKKRHRFQRVQSPNAVYMRPADGGSDTDMVKVTVQSNNAGAVANGGTLQSHNTDNVQVLEAGNLIISIELLRNVTNNFSEDNVLGRGGFGVVYKGELDDGTKIAVKRMLASVVSNKGLDEFQAEIAVLTKVRHRHLVAMLGYCIEGNERLLVYEYMPLGTLSQHLFEWKKLNLPPLSWDKRLSIALDVARAVEYLHGLAQKSFIHRDLKPSNVLLGDDYRAKVSDFGLVKLAPEGKFSVETRLAGTFGYLAPEYAVTGRVTTKADVFSFGVILMELITGRKALDETQPEESMHLVTWFRRLMGNKQSIFKAVDPAVEVNDETSQSILIVAELAGHCTGREPYNRPDMSHAVNVLSPLVEQWKPADAAAAEDDEGIDLHMSLPQALKRWQAIEGGGSSITAAAAAVAGDGPSNYFDDITRGSVASMPAFPSGLVHSFTSSDGR